MRLEKERKTTRTESGHLLLKRRTGGSEQGVGAAADEKAIEKLVEGSEYDFCRGCGLGQGEGEGGAGSVRHH